MRRTASFLDQPLAKKVPELTFYFWVWLAVPGSQGGLNLGKGPISIALWVLIIAFVAYLAITHRDVARQPGRPHELSAT